MFTVKENDFSKVLDSDSAVVMFSADWCPYCQKLEPIFEKVALDMEGDFEFYYVDIDENTEVAQEYEIELVPTIVVFKNGNEDDRAVNPEKEEILRDFLNNAI